MVWPLRYPNWRPDLDRLVPSLARTLIELGLHAGRIDSRIAPACAYSMTLEHRLAVFGVARKGTFERRQFVPTGDKPHRSSTR